MASQYDPALIERLCKEALAVFDALPVPQAGAANHRHLAARAKIAAMADQLESAKREVDSVKTCLTRAYADASEVESLLTAERDALRAEVDLLRATLNGVRIYADRCDASGPEDGGNYTYLTVARELRVLVSPVATKDPNA